MNNMNDRDNRDAINLDREKQREEFFKLLNDNNDDNDETNNSKQQKIDTIIDRCMITDSELQDNSVTLKCGHQFNYIPLYNEIKYQKTNKYSITYDYTKLGINQIKCPYCRTITNNILPYFNRYSNEIDNVELIRGVTTPSKYSLKINQCQHYIKTKDRQCNSSACITAHGILCNRHYNNVVNRIQRQTAGLNNNNNNDKHDNDTSAYIPFTTAIYKMRVPQLKSILKLNNCRVGGTRDILINRILDMRQTRSDWTDYY